MMGCLTTTQRHLSLKLNAMMLSYTYLIMNNMYRTGMLLVKVENQIKTLLKIIQK